ncbi:hypothetical protein AKJ09_07443 [Labilithrix luteola]|uniref:IgGFc-binding protein N-terminal domain-containing protein n=2 Tax=Labilithrix luteola TaxID=1391654 RepID=A0A0K1Q5W0_9BACT|nr:hypothetical protein AKJ09_07443 [Labilithrix luteola]
MAGLASAVSIVSCGSSSDDGGSSGGNGGTSESNGVFDQDGGEAGPSLAGCSSDLRSILDDSGRVKTTCPDDQGCSNGACVPACQAATANHGAVGCDFVVSTPNFQNIIAPPCYAVFLANNWPRPLKITVERDNQNLDVTAFGRLPVAGQPETAWPAVPATGVPSGQVAVLFLSSDPTSNNGGESPMNCPITPAVNAGTAVAGTGRGKAFHISTDTPVSAYDIHPYGGAKSFLPSASLLLPTSAWGKNYIAVVPKDGDYDNGTPHGPQWAHIVASQDTTVQIVPTTALPAAGNSQDDIPAAPPNAVATFKLKAGEFIQWQNEWNVVNHDPLELSGSIISSDQPIAFVGGNGYLCLKSSTNTHKLDDSKFGGCDSGHQVIPPVSALGFEYAVAPYTTRRSDLQDEAIPYRIVGAVDGTTLTYEPPVPNAPTNLKLGDKFDFEATGPFVVKSQDGNHPFYVGQMMTGGWVASDSRPGATPRDDNDATLGDEEYVNVPAPAQYLSKYVFFTDPTYPTTNLVIVRKKTAGGFGDVSVDCLGPITGWKPMGTGGNYEMTNVDLLRVGSSTNCQNGGHVATGTGPFGLIVWGLDGYASYAYPAGGNFATINSVVVPANPR